jgi:hypothetical protein
MILILKNEIIKIIIICPLFVRRGLFPFLLFSEPVELLPDDGLNRQPKHAAELNKNRYIRSV